MLATEHLLSKLIKVAREHVEAMATGFLTFQEMLTYQTSKLNNASTAMFASPA